MSRTPRNAHGARKSRRTHGTWGGAWGPSQSRGPVAAGLSESVGQKQVFRLGDPVVGWSNRGWGVGQGGQGGQEGLGALEVPSLCCTRSSGLTRAPWGALQTWWTFHPHWAPTAGVSCGASGPRKTLGTNSIISREQRWPLVFSGSWQPSRPPSPELPWATGEPQGGAGSSGGQLGSGPCPLCDSQPCHLGLQHLQLLSQFDTLLQLRKPEKPVGPKG